MIKAMKARWLTAVALFTATTSAQVATTTTLSAPATALIGQPVNLTASVQPRTSGTVEFLSGFTPIGTAVLDGNSQARLIHRFEKTGRHDLRAVFVGNATHSVSRSGSATVYLQRLQASGFVSTNIPYAGLMVDLNGDGLRDAVSAQAPANTFTVRLALANQTFGPDLVTQLPEAHYFTFFSDFDLDGKQDAGIGLNKYLRGRGDGTFDSAPSALNATYLGAPFHFAIAADLNLDGRLDALGVAVRDDPFRLALSNGGGAWDQAVTIPNASFTWGGSSFQPFALNLTNDERGDAAITSSAYRVGVHRCDLFLNRPTVHTLEACPTGALLTGDVNGDGVADLMTLRYESITNYRSEALQFNDGSGNFSTHSVSGGPAYESDQTVAVLDWNNDGKDDLIVVAPDGNFTVRISQGNGQFAAPERIGFTLPADTYFINFTEANGDGRLDVLVGSTTGSPSRVLLGSDNAAPTGGTLSPAQIMYQPGAPRQVTVTFSDANGAASLKNVYLLLGNDPTASEKCVFTLDVAANTISLSDASPSSITPGSGSLSNPRCFLLGEGTGVTAAGNTLTLTLNIGLSGLAPNAGPMFIRAVDTAGSDTGYLTVGGFLRGQWPSTPPEGLALTPTSGSGGSSVFRISASDGDADIALMHLLIGPAITPRNVCMVEVNRVANTVGILSDNGTTYTRKQIGSTGTIANNQCSVNPANVVISGIGSTVEVTIPVTFTSQFNGDRIVFVQAVDAPGRVTGLQRLGTWRVSGQAVQQPRPGVQTLSPLSGTGTTGTFTGVFTHSGGASQHYLGYLVFLRTPNHVGFTAKDACIVEYNRISNGVRLINDAGDDWLGPISGVPIAPSAPVLSNSRCSVDVSKMTASVSGPTMSVTATVTFTREMSRTLATFLQAFDVTGQYTPMTQFGNWIAWWNDVSGGTLPPAPGPFVATGTAHLGANRTAGISADFAHTGGTGRLGMMHVLIGNSIMDPAPCQIVIFGGGGVNLINDTGTALVAPQAIQAGTPGTLANSRCALNTGSASYGTVSQHQVHTSMQVTFGPVFTGSKNVYAVAFDDQGLVTHWVQIGVLNLP